MNQGISMHFQTTYGTTFSTPPASNRRKSLAFLNKMGKPVLQVSKMGLKPHTFVHTVPRKTSSSRFMRRLSCSPEDPGPPWQGISTTRHAWRRNAT